MAQVDGNTTVTIINGNVIVGDDNDAKGNVYGGGLGQLADTETGKNAMEAKVGNSQVNLGAMVDDGAGNSTPEGDAIVNNIFGCNNLNGAPTGTVTVTVINGTVKENVYGGGNQAAATVNPEVNINGGTIEENVYGGGLGKTAVINGNPIITVTKGTINKDVYGGGALADVTGSTEVNIEGGTVIQDVYGGGALANVSEATTVNLTGGTIRNSYGGGLGSTEVEALVNGNATTTLNGSVVKGSIYGANNVNGTPLGHVKVHVTGTTPRDGQGEDEYDVPAVYGGGNQAAYVPTGSYEAENPGTSLTDKTKFAEVLIEGCDNSIEYVYGGGNAAPVPATRVTIYGGIISKAFAGGNGKGDGNKGADVGYLGFYSEKEESTPKYGSGTTSITIYGGTIGDVYGGSNTLGYIRENASVAVDKLPENSEYEGEPCPLNVTNVHGGGNQAPMHCNGSVTLNCTKGVDVIYGGAQNADIRGDVELNITSGTYKTVFCGNNEKGNIYGSLKVNIDETGCWPIIIGELYGCGNDAAYSVYGYDADGNCVTSGEKQYADPEVNIISCTSIGKIFGGGQGKGATVYGNPIVNINTIEGAFAGKTVPDGFMILNNEGEREEASEAEQRTIPAGVGTIGTVYGGGNQAAVHGNTTVNIGTLEKNKHLKQSAENNVSVRITDDVFGGGKTAEVTGKATVKIGK